MTAPRPGNRHRRRRTAPPSGAQVLSLDARRLEKAVAQRTRYRYVQPRVEREGLGWKVCSPNCSRNIDPQGGDIDIAWLVPAREGGWLLYARDHGQDCWQLRAQGGLPALLVQLSTDPEREFWQ